MLMITLSSITRTLVGHFSLMVSCISVTHREGAKSDGQKDLSTEAETEGEMHHLERQPN